MGPGESLFINLEKTMPTTLTDDQLEQLLAILGVSTALSRLYHVEAVAVFRVLEARGYQITPPAAE
jgi:hypothetical protein